MTPRRSVWWLWPATPLVMVVGVTLLGASAISEDVYVRAWRTPKELDGYTTVVLLGGVVALVVGVLLSGMAERDPNARPAESWPALSDEAFHLLRRAYPWLIGMTIFGYVAWIGNGISKGLTFGDVEAVLTTQDNFKLPVKEKLETLPGITTLTQVAIPAAIVGVIIDLHRPRALVRYAYRLVLLLAAARALMLAERLAVAEILVPVMMLRAAALGRRLRGTPQVILGLAPFLAVFILLVGFAASEYSRSWNWYSGQRDQNFVEFSSERLLGYYATSHNNGALLLKYGTEFGDIPYYTTTFFWEIPPGSQLGGGLADDASADRRRILRDFGNPEFNSPSGIASVFVDYGVVGGHLFYLAIGVLIGAIHLSFIHGRVFGILLYPIVFTGLLELPRYLYWFQGRTTPAVLVAITLAGYLAASARKRLRRQAFSRTPHGQIPHPSPSFSS